MNPVALVLRIALGLVVALVAVGGIVYATDYGLQATVVSKDCGTAGGSTPSGGFPLAAPSVTVKTKIGGLHHTESLAPQYCAVVQPGNFVIYHIRSGRTILYQSEGGRCLYDSASGLAQCPS